MPVPRSEKERFAITNRAHQACSQNRGQGPHATPLHLLTSRRGAPAMASRPDELLCTGGYEDAALAMGGSTPVGSVNESGRSRAQLPLQGRQMTASQADDGAQHRFSPTAAPPVRRKSDQSPSCRSQIRLILLAAASRPQN